MKKLILFLLAFIFIHNSYISAQPDSPLLENPPKGTDVVVLPAVLDWNNVPGADCYYFEVLEDTLNASTNQFCMTTTSSVDIPVNALNPNTTYYWRVYANNSGGWSAPSEFFSFTTSDGSAITSIENLSDGVIDLIAEEDIPQNQGNILLNRLAQAQTRVENGQEFLAILNMYIFKARIIILRASNQISSSVYNSLNYSSDGVIDLISETLGRPTAFNNLQQPETYKLAQNYPNPFNPSTTIEYSIPENSFVSLKIYDMTGREISTLVSKHQETGTYIVDWNASKLSSGVYFYRLTAGNFTETKKMILAK